MGGGGGGGGLCVGDLMIIGLVKATLQNDRKGLACVEVNGRKD